MFTKKALKSKLALVIALIFLTNSFSYPIANARDMFLPAPGAMVHLSPPLDPPIFKGIKVYPDNPFRFDFILDKGNSCLGNDQLKEESTKLIKYFLASLTIPEKDLWVNLSPYEKDRIVPQSFGLTEMGRDLLAEDYMLKQITASLIYPEDAVGKIFWKRIYQEAEKKFGTTNIPVNTFNKVWIIPEKAVVYENSKAGTAYVVDSKLKVMLEQDYLSLEKHAGIRSEQTQVKDANQIGSQVVREIVIPQLEKEVNEDKNFAQLRQVYNSLILATWYKKKIKESILAQVYSDKNKVVGVNIDDPQEKEKIYQQYLKAFKKGVYNYIKQDIDPATQETVPRKYFSGGFSLFVDKVLQESENTAMITPDMAVRGHDSIVKVMLDEAMNTGFRKKRSSLSEAFAAVTDGHRKVFDVGELLRQNFTNYQPNRGKFIFTLRKVSDEDYPEAYLLDVFDINAPQKMSIAQLYFSLSFVGRVRVAKLGVSAINGAAGNDRLVAVLNKEGIRSSSHGGYWKFRPLDGLWIKEEYRNKGSEELWNLDRLMMAIALTIAQKRGVTSFLVNSISDRVDYYHQKFGAEPNADLLPGIYNLRIEINGPLGDTPYIIRKEGRRGMEMFLVKDEPDTAMNTTLTDMAASLGPSNHLALFSYDKGTGFSMVVPAGFLTPKTSKLIDRLKTSASVENFAMTSDHGRLQLTLKIKKRVDRVKASLRFIPWSRYAARIMWAGTAVLAPIAFYKFKSSPEALINLMDTVLLSVILALELGDRQTKKFMEIHDYYLKVLKSFYEEGVFTNGHNSKEVMDFYKHYYSDFVDNLDDEQEAKTLMLLAGTLTKEEVVALRTKKSKSMLEQRLELVLNELATRREKFMKVHDGFLSALREANSGHQRLPSKYISEALRFFTQKENNRNFKFFLTKQQREDIARLLAFQFSEADKRGIKKNGPDQPTAIQELIYWDIQLEATEEGDKAPVKVSVPDAEAASPAMMNQGLQQFDVKQAEEYFTKQMNQPDRANKEFPGLIRMNAKTGKIMVSVSGEPYGTGNDHNSLLKGTVFPPNSASGRSEWILMKWEYGDDGKLRHLSLIPPLVVNPRKDYSVPMRLFLGLTKPELPENAGDQEYQRQIHDEIIRIARTLSVLSTEPEKIGVVTSLETMGELANSHTNLRTLADFPTYNEPESPLNDLDELLAFFEQNNDFRRGNYIESEDIPVTVQNGVHGRVASELVKTVNAYRNPRVHVDFLYTGPDSKTRTFNMNSVMQVLMAGVENGHSIRLRSYGADQPLAQEIVGKIRKIFDPAMNTPEPTAKTEAAQTSQDSIDSRAVSDGVVGNTNGKFVKVGGQVLPALLVAKALLIIDDNVKLELQPWDRSNGFLMFLKLSVDHEKQLKPLLEKLLVVLGQNLIEGLVLTEKDNTQEGLKGYGVLLKFKDKGKKANIKGVVSSWVFNLLPDKIYPSPQGATIDSDKAMIAPINGGIDLNNLRNKLQMQDQGGEIKFHIDPAMLQQLQNAPGFYPQVLSVEPLNNLQQFLGISDSRPLTPVSSVL